MSTIQKAESVQNKNENVLEFTICYSSIFIESLLLSAFIIMINLILETKWGKSMNGIEMN